MMSAFVFGEAAALDAWCLFVVDTLLRDTYCLRAGGQQSKHRLRETRKCSTNKKNISHQCRVNTSNALCIDMASSLPTNRRQRLLRWNLMSCRIQHTLLFDAAANELTTDLSFIGITGDWCPALHRPEYSSATTRTQRMRCYCSGREIPSGWPLLAFGMRSSCKELFGRKSSSSAWR